MAERARTCTKQWAHGQSKEPSTEGATRAARRARSHASEQEKKKRPTAEERTEEQQYEMEYQVRTEIDNAFYEVHVQLAQWIERGGNKNDGGILAAFWELEIYTRGYIEAKKTSLIGTETEGKRNIASETMERKIQEAARY